jgi:hypothetical protein
MTAAEFSQQMHAMERRLNALKQREAYIEELWQAWRVEWQVFLDEYGCLLAPARARDSISEDEVSGS